MNIEKLARNIEKRQNSGKDVSGETRAHEIERLEKALEMQLQRKRMMETFKDQMDVAEISALDREGKSKEPEEEKKVSEIEKNSEKQKAQAENKREAVREKAAEEAKAAVMPEEKDIKIEASEKDGETTVSEISETKGAEGTTENKIEPIVKNEEKGFVTSVEDFVKEKSKETGENKDNSNNR